MIGNKFPPKVFVNEIKVSEKGRVSGRVSSGRKVEGQDGKVEWVNSSWWVEFANVKNNAEDAKKLSGGKGGDKIVLNEWSITNGEPYMKDGATHYSNPKITVWDWDYAQNTSSQSSGNRASAASGKIEEDPYAD